MTVEIIPLRITTRISFLPPHGPEELLPFPSPIPSPTLQSPHTNSGELFPLFIIFNPLEIRKPYMFGLTLLGVEPSTDSISFPTSANHVRPVGKTLSEIDYLLITMLSLSQQIRIILRLPMAILFNPMLTLFPFHLMLEYTTLHPCLRNIFVTRMLSYNCFE